MLNDQKIAKRSATLICLGTWPRAHYQKHRASFLEATEAIGLVTSSELFSGYHVLSMPRFMCRNKVLMEVQATVA